MSEELVIGVDLGGTKIEAVVARRSGDPPALTVVSRRRVPTASERGYEAVLDAAVAVFYSYLACKQRNAIKTFFKPVWIVFRC